MSGLNSSEFNQLGFNEQSVKQATASLSCRSRARGFAKVDKSDYTVLNEGSGGIYFDMTEVTHPETPTNRKRQRVIPAGEGIDDVMSPDIGVVVRPIHSPYPGDMVIDLGSVSNIPSNTEATIASYVVPDGKTFHFLGIVAHGDIHGDYVLYIGTDAKCSGRTSPVAPTCRINFEHALFSAGAGVEVRLNTTHHASGKQGNFEGTLIGYVL